MVSSQGRHGRRFASVAAAGALLLLPLTAGAQDSGRPAIDVTASDLSLASESEQQAAVAAPSTPDESWADWLAGNDLVEGENHMPDGRSFFIASASAQVRANFQSADWIDARQSAFNSALLGAKSQLANIVGAVLRSDRSMEILQQGGDTVPPAVEQVREDVSIIERMHKLTAESLDSQIRKFDPSWDGGDPEMQQEKVVTLEERYRENLAASARLLLEGAIPVFNVEGDSRDGQYSVLVGVVWSPRMAALAESLYNPRIDVPRRQGGQPVIEQIEAKLAQDPDFLAISQGARVWTQEDGARVLVSFAPVHRGSSSMANDAKAALIGRSQMAQFVAEDIAARAMSQGGTAFREYDDGSDAVFNDAVFNDAEFRNLIRAKAQTVQIQGAVRAYTWQGQHPEAQVAMQTDVYVWSPDSREMARRMEDMAGDDAVGPAARGDGEGRTGPDSGNVAAPVRSGAGSNPTDF